MSDIFSDENKVKSNFWSPKAVGASCSGFLVKKELWDNRLKAGAKQTIYHLIQEDGQKILVAGRQGNPAVLSGLENCKLGQKVGVKYVSDKLAQKAGHNPTKIIQVYAADEFRPDLVEAEKLSGMNQVGTKENTEEAF